MTDQQKKQMKELIKQNKGKPIEHYSCKVHSEFGEDGVLYFIFHVIGVHERTCALFQRDYKIKRNPVKNLIENHGFTCLNDPLHDECTRECVGDFASNNKKPLDLLCIDVDNSVEYWLLKEYQKNAIVKPRVICVKYNYILGKEHAITAPYTANIDGIFDTDYRGTSLKGFQNVLHDYVFIGCLKFALMGFFVLKSEIKDQFKDLIPEADIDYCFSYPNVQYGIAERFEKVRKKFWVQIKEQPWIIQTNVSGVSNVSNVSNLSNV
jgi:hypothetical protein